MKRATQETLYAYGFLAFPLLIIAFFVLLPSLGSILLSFFHYDGSSTVPPRFLGLDNYKLLFFSEPLFWGTVRNTFVFALSVVPLTVGLGFLFALPLNADWFVGRHLVRLLFFLPSVVSIVAIGFVWQWIFNPSFGLLNGLMDSVGLPPQPWLGHPRWAMPCVVLIAVWHGLGFSVILYSAALQNIPAELYEAAGLDGATAWQQAVHVTWPLVAPTTLFLFITGLIAAFQVFDLVYIMTAGGPANATNVLNNLLYRKFIENDLGVAAAISVVIFGIILLITLAQTKLIQPSHS